MTIAVAPAPSSGRIHATPYARRLARERNLPLSAIAGSGPNGRITAIDLVNFRQAAEPAAQPLAAVATSPSVPSAPDLTSQQAATIAQQAAGKAAPTAIAARVDFAALDALLERIAELRPGVGREDVCLRAAALALGDARAMRPANTILLLTAPDGRQALKGLAETSLGAIPKLRQGDATADEAGLAISFIGRAGVRPVAAQLVGAPARLVVGAVEKDGGAECLLSYDADTVPDDKAEEFLVGFRDLVETPLRLLV
ncbi:E3 binding domain-containing protein [Mesorhizobium sp. LHD-90]|uniref:E3 binding domain-containing protein n=1 Tax=Mesorhizobium sp. LHD-90 TaxID=3071414 RepID=UPI0027E05257|nr:E3 binding domain-containing protein [Mesorhizobium sp. LHD-90]MDQ6435367.1 E3 binding domain-containing protein [Mesorhizobium sp. LHD-90]